jgi:hypothetical protein
MGQAADVITFALFFYVVPESILRALQGIQGHEQHPVTLTAFALGGVTGVALMKLGLVSFAVWRSQGLSKFGSRPQRVFGWVIVAGGVTGFIGAFFNLYALYQLGPYL